MRPEDLLDLLDTMVKGRKMVAFTYTNKILTMTVGLDDDQISSAGAPTAKVAIEGMVSTIMEGS